MLNYLIMLKYLKTLIFILIVLHSSCNAQEKSKEMINRKPVVAGRFYPLDKNELKNELKDFFDKAEKKYPDNIRALIAPHAGYVYSGEVAAAAYAQIDAKKKL